MVARPEIDAVMLVGFGGPTSPDEVRAFLDNVLRGRPVPRERYEEVVHHYERLGGRSPYNDFTMKQAEALRAALKARGIPLPVAVGMRNWTPYVADSLRELAEKGARRVFAFILAAHRCEASWDRYQQTVREALEKLGGAAPEVEYPAPWHAHPLFIRALAARARDAYARLAPEDRSTAHLIFTAHSIPIAMAAASNYVDELTESSRLVAADVGAGAWTLAFQSRSGSPREPWLEPDIATTLKKLAGRAAVVVPIGFLCDHVEVLYDLDVETQAIAREALVRMERAPTVGDHPLFIEMISSMVQKRIERSISPPAQ
jgi:protoporphyrin/coproporphyrin ferrochelatase